MLTDFTLVHRLLKSLIERTSSQLIMNETQNVVSSITTLDILICNVHVDTAFEHSMVQYAQYTLTLLIVILLLFFIFFILLLLYWLSISKYQHVKAAL